MTAKIDIYLTTYCPYCARAKELLKRKGVPFNEFDLTNDDAGRAALVERANGRKTVPQIFINGQHIGGCDDLHALDADGRLDAMLQ